MIHLQELFPYSFAPEYSKPVAYFSMEFAVDQSLKIYSGGLGFLAGSHLRSAYELKQNFIGIGIMWKYGYYDQSRNMDGTMKPVFVEKNYSFLVDTGIVFPISIHNHTVKVKAMLLKPSVFHTAPLFLLTTDLPENDHLAQTISHRLYDPHESARIAQSSLLGIGGAKLLEILNRETQIYHLNEGHALPLCFYLWDKLKDLEEVKKRVVFTTHTPELAGNEERDAARLEVMSFFGGVSREKYHTIMEPRAKNLNYTLSALRMAKVANGVSQLHGEVARKMWNGYERICQITAITNAQNHTYWKDEKLERAFENNDQEAVRNRKHEHKQALFELVADQTGKRFDVNVLTIVWARRFAGYKRANLLLNDFERFLRIVQNTKYPVQVIWAGKPYPEDHDSIHVFNDIHWKTKSVRNCAIVTGYELKISAMLKRGSDIWLNNPKIYHEASGTSGMTAAMNGSINFSIPDGWVPEFSHHRKNSFVIEAADRALSEGDQNRIESDRMYDILEKEIQPMYYENRNEWFEIMKQSWRDVLTAFDSNRMAREYYEKMYN